MKRTTIKTINASLPRLDDLRRELRPANRVGWDSTRDTFGGAFADIDAEAGECTGIRAYGVGEGMEERHYRADRYPETVIDISDVIEAALNGADRRETVRAIQAAIMERAGRPNEG